jgi:trk system potassium uptake protein TrkH
MHGVYPGFWAAMRHTAFNLVSIATDCGFVSQDYAAWPMFAPMVILMLSCYCANTGSTGGGIKMFRTLVLFRQAQRELFLLVHPAAVTPVKIGGQVVANKIVFAVLAFVVLYFGAVVTLTFLLLASGMDFISAFWPSSHDQQRRSGLGTVGPASYPGPFGLPDLGLLAGDAAWPSGDLLDAGPVYAHFLAQVSCNDGQAQT